MTQGNLFDIIQIANDAEADRSGLVNHLRALALDAGSAILKATAPSGSGDTGDWDTGAWSKADGSPVTQADHAAERIILDSLRRLDDRITIVSEEAFAAGHKPDVTDVFWLVDPLDGTREFVSGNGEYTVNIALISNSRPVLGIVHAPAKGLSAWGVVGNGAFESDHNGAVRPLAVRQIPDDGAVVIASRHHGDQERLKAFLGEQRVSSWRSVGSSLKFIEIAAGRADIYPRFGATMEWDTAAGDAILTAAGGATIMTDGALLPYGKPGYRNPEFVASAGSGGRQQ